MSAAFGAAYPTTNDTRQAHESRTARFMDMARAALSAKPSAAPEDRAATQRPSFDANLPRVRTVQEMTADLRENRAERRRSHEQARREAGAPSPPQEFPQNVREAYSASACVMVRPVQGPPPEPVPDVLDLAELLDLVELRPKRGRGAGTEGPGRLARLLHELARHVFKARGYRLIPGQIVFHTSQELLAEALGVDVATVRRWTRQLEARVYCDSRPHYSDMTRNGEMVAAVDGTLYAVRLTPGHRARLGYDDLSYPWRDLDADRKAGRTAWALLKDVRQKKEQARKDGKKILRGSTSPVLAS